VNTENKTRSREKAAAITVDDVKSQCCADCDSTYCCTDYAHDCDSVSDHYVWILNCFTGILMRSTALLYPEEF
jgi:hypothetical protein